MGLLYEQAAVVFWGEVASSMRAEDEAKPITDVEMDGAWPADARSRDGR